MPGDPCPGERARHLGVDGEDEDSSVVALVCRERGHPGATGEDPRRGRATRIGADDVDRVTHAYRVDGRRVGHAETDEGRAATETLEQARADERQLGEHRTLGDGSGDDPPARVLVCTERALGDEGVGHGHDLDVTRAYARA